MEKLIAKPGRAFLAVAILQALVAGSASIVLLATSAQAEGAKTLIPTTRTNGYNGGDPSGSEAVAPTATQPAFYPPTIRERVTPLILSGDTAKLEEFYKAYSAVPEDARLDYVAQRTMFGLFHATGPEVAKASADWMHAYPESPYAMAARGWYLYDLGTQMRGTAFPAFTYPEAMDKAMAYFREAAELGSKAHTANPSLIAASDLMIRAAAYLGETALPETILAEVMANQPNRGTLLRAAAALAPKWLGHGTTDALDRLCPAYAGKLTTIVNYTQDVCHADVYYSAGLPRDRLAPLDDFVRNSVSWTLIDARAQVAMETQDYSDRGRRAVEEYLFDQEVDDTDAAFFLDTYIYTPQRRPTIGFDVASRRVQQGLDSLRLDPFDIRDIDRAAYLGIYTQLGQPGRPLHGALQGDAYRAALKGALTTAPYDSTIWLKIAYANDLDNLAGFAGVVPFFQNAIVYANHSPMIAGEFVAHAHNFDYNGRIDDASLCTVIRAIRIVEAQCPAGDGSWTCRPQYEPDVRKDFFDRATSHGLCDREIKADPEELAFTPVEIKWSRYKLSD